MFKCLCVIRVCHMHPAPIPLSYKPSYNSSSPPFFLIRCLYLFITLRTIIDQRIKPQKNQ